MNPELRIVFSKYKHTLNLALLYAVNCQIMGGCEIRATSSCTVCFCSIVPSVSSLELCDALRSQRNSLRFILLCFTVKDLLGNGDVTSWTPEGFEREADGGSAEQQQTEMMNGNR